MEFDDTTNANRRITFVPHVLTWDAKVEVKDEEEEEEPTREEGDDTRGWPLGSTLLLRATTLPKR